MSFQCDQNNDFTKQLLFIIIVFLCFFQFDHFTKQLLFNYGRMLWSINSILIVNSQLGLLIIHKSALFCTWCSKHSTW